ncbi:aminotransferase class I/II-fold pyridoxal phosphate-dependent enzyme [Granulicella arctica]|uniref:aminotransferase class I/II-fold pyridoxal phosphate-dependent enzyme n=1 Tax=Granulicella arctica TaxID=940613 RepID=UPI0037BE437D
MRCTGRKSLRLYALCKAISDYVGRHGVRCSPEQVIITSGAQHGLDLVSRFLLDPGDEVWMEDPGRPGARQASRAAGAAPVIVSIDAEGSQFRAHYACVYACRNR